MPTTTTLINSFPRISITKASLRMPKSYSLLRIISFFFLLILFSGCADSGKKNCPIEKIRAAYSLFNQVVENPKTFRVVDKNGRDIIWEGYRVYARKFTSQKTVLQTDYVICVSKGGAELSIGGRQYVFLQYKNEKYESPCFYRLLSSRKMNVYKLLISAREEFRGISVTKTFIDEVHKLSLSLFMPFELIHPGTCRNPGIACELVPRLFPEYLIVGETY